MGHEEARKIQLPGGRQVRVTPVFDTYWRFATQRQEIFLRRVNGEPGPWTDDPILLRHRFTNAYRASDRVSQYLIRNVLYSGSQEALEVFFRCLLFKFFNRIDTWEYLISLFGVPSWKDFSVERYSQALDRRMAEGYSIYSAAYIMPSPPFGGERKHSNHLALLQSMITRSVHDKFFSAKSLLKAFNILLECPSLGNFLAFQFTIDLNYSSISRFEEAEYVVAGPGARDGIRKCFVDTAGLSESELICAMSEIAPREFERLGLPFCDLWGRALQPIDCQNIFCEVDKYARVAHPNIQGRTGRTRIKQRFSPLGKSLPQWYPPKWRITPILHIARLRNTGSQTVFDFAS
jgi:alpha-glutamyl/putrescinyl thymine pyrophosphorylase clade 1